MLSAPLPAADGIRLVSMRGPSAGGAGKSLMPLSRMHWANLRATFCCSALRLWPVNPGGSRSLHALLACLNAALLGSTDDPFATPSMVDSPEASGSGNARTPLARMHSANFTAFSCVAAALLPPVSAGAFEQPATIAASMARAASGRSVLLMVSSPAERAAVVDDFGAQVVGLPWIERMARKAKQPPAAAVEPVLTPTTP